MPGTQWNQEWIQYKAQLMQNRAFRRFLRKVYPSQTSLHWSLIYIASLIYAARYGGSGFTELSSHKDASSRKFNRWLGLLHGTDAQTRRMKLLFLIENVYRFANFGLNSEKIIIESQYHEVTHSERRHRKYMATVFLLTKQVQGAEVIIHDEMLVVIRLQPSRGPSPGPWTARNVTLDLEFGKLHWTSDGDQTVVGPSPPPGISMLTDLDGVSGELVRNRDGVLSCRNLVSCDVAPDVACQAALIAASGQHAETLVYTALQPPPATTRIMPPTRYDESVRLVIL